MSLARPMTDHDRLCRDLDEVPWLTLLALADLAAEAGREQEADGWRWLAKYRRWPFQQYGHASWHPDKKIDQDGVEHVPAERATDVLWVAVTNKMPRSRDGLCRYPSVSAAFLAAAPAAGAWLAKLPRAPKYRAWVTVHGRPEPRYPVGRLTRSPQAARAEFDRWVALQPFPQCYGFAAGPVDWDA